MKLTPYQRRMLDIEAEVDALEAEGVSRGLALYEVLARHRDARQVFGEAHKDAPMTSTTAKVKVTGWGSTIGGHRVHHLTPEERAYARKGGPVLIEGCPAYRGITQRIVEIEGRFYTRMPAQPFTDKAKGTP